MTLPYLLRLLCLCLAAFFLIHLALGLVVTALAPLASGWAEHLRPRPATQFLLGLRLFPAAFSFVLVGGLCAPSYLLLEPPSTREEVSLWCVGAAILGIALLLLSAVRCTRAARRSLGYIRDCRMVGRQRTSRGRGFAGVGGGRARAFPGAGRHFTATPDYFPPGDQRSAGSATGGGATSRRSAPDFTRQLQTVAAAAGSGSVAVVARVFRIGTGMESRFRMGRRR